MADEQTGDHQDGAGKAPDPEKEFPPALFFRNDPLPHVRGNRRGVILQSVPEIVIKIFIRHIHWVV